MKKKYIVLLLLCIGCSRSESVKIKIGLDLKNSTLAISGIDSLILNDIARDTAANWTSLFPVYKMPVDTDMKDFQTEQPGIYWVDKGRLFFKPDTAFKMRQTYFLRYYDHASGKNVWNYIRDNKRKGAPGFTDLTFTP